MKGRKQMRKDKEKTKKQNSKIMSKVKRKTSGITLIALVVTIVVLLILAAVSISMLGGENGIITQAIKAQEENKEEEAKEEVYLYWNEAQINYEDTIEKKVELLEKRMQEKDASAAANILDGQIIANYKGYDVIIPYIDSVFDEEITYLTAVGGTENNEERIIYLYITKDSKIYITDNDREICLNDKFEELNDEKNLKSIGYGNSGDIRYYTYMSDQKFLRLTLQSTDVEDIFNFDNYSLEIVFDIKTIEDGKYKDKNIKFIELEMMRMVILDDGFLYVLDDENKLQKLEIPYIENNAKIENISIIANNSGEILFLIIDQNGKIYNTSTTENISNSYANGFFKDKSISYATVIRKEREVYNIFMTKDGKAYMQNISTDEIVLLNDMTTNLNNKKIINVYNLSDDFEEDYIIIVTEEGKTYYTEDFINFYSLNIDGFPKLTIKYS